MNLGSKVVIAVLLLSIVVVVGGAFILSNATQPMPVDPTTLVGDIRWERGGGSDAKITIVEYSDFQCPACRSAAPFIKQVVEEHQGQVRLIYRHFPLIQIHQNALDAAIATEIVGEQGRFWEMHDLLFVRQDDWSQVDNARDLFAQYAEELGMNSDEFLAGYENDEFEMRVRNDLQDGRVLGINSTPTVFVGEERVQVQELAGVVSAQLNQD